MGISVGNAGRGARNTKNTVRLAEGEATLKVPSTPAPAPAKNDTSSSLSEDFLRQLSNENTAKTFAFNSAEAEKSRAWQTEMSNTAHQRQVEDLKRAGLNPVLSANSGASSYSASSASGSADSTAVGALASIYQTRMNNDNARKIAEMQIKQQKLDNKNALQIAKINAAASNYASNNSYAASRYASDVSAGASRYSADSSASASRYKTDTSYASTDFGVLDNMNLPKGADTVAKSGLLLLKNLGFKISLGKNKKKGKK